MTTVLNINRSDLMLADPHGYRVASRIKERTYATGKLKVRRTNTRNGGPAAMEAVASDIAEPAQSQAVDAQIQKAAYLASLVEAMRGGNECALEELYDATVGKLYALASAILRNAEDAEEIVCSTYSYVWANAARFESSRANALGWLLMLCRSRALDRLRYRRVMGTTIELDEIAESVASDEPRPDDLLAVFQQRSRVHQALAKLSPERRNLVSLAFLRGLSHQEIAAQSGLALGTVKSHVRRALAQLREELEAE